MKSTIYVNKNELPIARRAISGFVSDAEAKELFSRPEYLINLLRDEAIRDIKRAQKICNSVDAAIKSHRRRYY